MGYGRAEVEGTVSCRDPTTRWSGHPLWGRRVSESKW